MTLTHGLLVNMDEAYRTMDREYVESVWWALKQIWDKGLLVRTTGSAVLSALRHHLSDHELRGAETSPTRRCTCVR